MGTSAKGAIGRIGLQQQFGAVGIPNEALAYGDVHVWRVMIEPMLACGLDTLWEELAPDERDRANRFHFEIDCRRFAATRVALRRIMAGYTGSDPNTVSFVAGPHGKPMLADGATSGPGELRFNTARSGKVGLVAVARHAEVGVDVELVVDDFPWDEVALRAFNAQELAPIEAFPPGPERTCEFVRAWVRKEAWAKAIGLGMAHVLDGDLAIPDRYSTHEEDLRPFHGYLGALALVEDPRRDLERPPSSGAANNTVSPWRKLPHDPTDSSPCAGAHGAPFIHSGTVLGI